MFTYAQPKKIKDQVIVVTGASSGIGLATAELAATQGAQVVMSSFDKPALETATKALRERGYIVCGYTADVSNEEEVKGLARFAFQTYGRIDTWINNAGVHIFGKIEDVELKDARRVFEVDFWGMVYGSRAALPYLKQSKGSLINVGSVLSSHPIPLQGYYGASKHAVKSYTHSLRMELEAHQIPVAVSLIEPSAIHTPIVRHSKSILNKRAQLPPPHYSPEVAARGILSCAKTPRRELIIGGAGILGIWAEKFAPSLADQLMKLGLFKIQKTQAEPRHEDAIYKPMGDSPRKEGQDRRLVLRHSLFTWAETHPWSVGAAALAAFAMTGLARQTHQRKKRLDRV